MIKGDEARFVSAMKVTADIYGKEPFSIEALKMFFVLLQNYSIKQVEKALQDHIAFSPFIPKPCDIISRLNGTPEERAALAWALVLKAVRQIGHYNSVAFPSPAYIFALNQMGGWPKFCNSLRDEELTWRGKDFERFFIIGDRCATWNYENDKVHVEPYCIGTFEINNRRSGYASPEVIDATTRLPIAGGRIFLPKSNKQATEVIQAVAEGMIFK